jgi:hypothetical protein
MQKLVDQWWGETDGGLKLKIKVFSVLEKLVDMVGYRHPQ